MSKGLMTRDAEVLSPSLVKRAKEVHARLKELKSNIEKSYSEMGRLLYEMEKKVLHTVLGYDRFEEYVEKEMNFKARKGFYLKAIYEKLVVTAGVSEKEMEEIDWSKAREISRVATKKNVRHLMDVAKTETYEGVKAEVNKEIAKESGEKAPEPLHVVRFGLFEEQHKLWVRALKISSEVGRTDKTPRMVELICMEFLSSRLEDLGREGSLKWWLKRIENAFGVKVIAVDPTKNEVLHGKKLLEALDKEEEEA